MHDCYMSHCAMLAFRLATDVRDAGGQPRHAASGNSGLDRVCQCGQPRASRHIAFGACIAPQRIITALPQRFAQLFNFLCDARGIVTLPPHFCSRLFPAPQMPSRCCTRCARTALESSPCPSQSCVLLLAPVASVIPPTLNQAGQPDPIAAVLKLFPAAVRATAAACTQNVNLVSLLQAVGSVRWRDAYRLLAPFVVAHGFVTL